MFIGLSQDQHKGVLYTQSFDIPWPNGIVTRGRRLKPAEARFLAGPTLYVIGRDGRVAWHDGGARSQHAIHNLRKRLTQAIDRELAR